MSVCRKHKREGKRTCSCRVSTTVANNGYGGPDYTDIAYTGFDSVFNAAHDSGQPGGGDSVSGSE